MKYVVLCNASAGTLRRGAGPSPDQIASTFADYGADAEVRNIEAKQLRDAARELAHSPKNLVVVAAGGDGTINSIAQGLHGSDVPLGVLPLGTLNHFAKDLGLPLPWEQAIAAIIAARVEAVDVGMVNDRLFFNNASLGMYPWLVVQRDETVRRHHIRKGLAMTLAALRVFHRFPLVQLQLQVADDRLNCRTPLLFVGNNRYRLQLPGIGSRSSLQDGVLSLHLATAQNRWAMFKLGLRATIGRLRESRDFQSYDVEELAVESPETKLRVALDGEVCEVPTPLKFRILPRSLKVLVAPTRSS